MRELRQIIGRCPAAIYNDIRAGTFPRPVRLGRTSRWLVVEIDEWLEARAAERPAPRVPSQVA